MHDEYLMMVVSIEVYEVREVGTSDIKGAHLHAEQCNFTAAKLMNDQVDVMLSINPQCKNCAIMKVKNKVLCLILYKDLNVTARTAILWHTLLTNNLVDLDFKLNLCYFCVANTTLKGKRYTIVHRVDGTKVSRLYKEVIRKVHDVLGSKFGSMKAVIGKEHDFLGVKNNMS